MEEVKKLIAEDPEQILELIRNINKEESQQNPARKIVSVRKRGESTSQPIQNVNIAQTKRGRNKKDPNTPKRKITPRTAERLASGREKLKERNEFMKKAKELERKQKLAKESDEVNNIVNTKISEKTTTLEDRIKRLEDGYINLSVAKPRRKKVVTETETDTDEVYVKKRKPKAKKQPIESDLESESSYVPPKMNIADIRKQILNDPYFHK